VYFSNGQFLCSATGNTAGFVGREREFGQLSAALRDTLGGQGCLAVLVGEPGIGKTRTAQEFMDRCVGQDVPVLWATCYEGEEVPPYGPWIAAFQKYIRASKATTLVTQMDQGAAVIAEIIPELREKLSDLAAPDQLPPAEARIRLFDCMITFLTSVAQGGGLVIIIDNLQWADSSSLQFLEHFVSETQQSKILVLGTYRDEELSRSHPLARVLGELVKYPSFRRIRLGGLSRAEVGRYIEGNIDGKPDSEIVENYHNRSDGNPLFLVEMVRDLMERSPSESQSVSLPEGIRQAIWRRLNRLPAECTHILSLASVIGGSFELRVLARVAQRESEESVLEYLEQALAADLIEEESETIGGYRFSHVLIQEVLAEDVSAARKARRHARIANAMESLYGEDPGPRTGELLRHLTAAVDHLGSEKLVRYALLAAEKALASHAPNEALALTGRAIAIKKSRRVNAGKDDSETAALYYIRGSALCALGDGAGAEDSMIRAFDIYEALGDKNDAIRVALTRVPRQMRAGSYQV